MANWRAELMERLEQYTRKHQITLKRELGFGYDGIVSEEVMEEWRAEKAEQFGDRWPEVQRVVAAFHRWGIYLADVKPGNIEFKD
jgi:hypothetical protein